MPRLQDIERFKRDLAALSREAETLARWGETPEGPAAPAAAPEESLSGAEMPDEGLPPDFAALLDELPLEKAEGAEAEPFDAMGAELEALLAPAGPEEAEPAAEEPAEEGSPEEAFPLEAAPEGGSQDTEDFLAGLDLGEAPADEGGTETESAGGFSIEELPAEEPSAEEPASAEPLPEEAAPGAEDFLAGLELGEEGSQELPSEVEPLEAGAPNAPEESGLPGLEDFAMPDFGEPGAFEAPPGEETAGEAGPGEAAAPAEDFALPEDFSIPEAEPSPEPDQGAAPAEEDFSIPDFSEEAPQAPAAEAQADDFSIPDFDLEAPGPAASGEGPEAGPAEAEAPVPGFEAEPGGPGAEDSSLEPLASGEGEEGFSFALGEEPAAGPGGMGGSAGLPSGDDFESFSFEEPAAPGLGGREEAGLGGLGGDLDSELASLGDAGAAADTFSIDRDWGGFGEAASGAEPPRQAPPRPSSRPAAEEQFKPVSLSEAQVDRLQDSLLSYPLNLRVAIEDILANEKGSEAQRSRLVWAMVEGASAEDAAGAAARVLKRRIEIPKGFEKRTGAAFEAEKGSLAYAFIHTVLPVLRVALVAAALAGTLGWLGYRYVYKALAANAAYRSGYQRIAESRYPEAEASFEKARGYRDHVAWYYRYAEAYAAKRQYLLAEKKYAELVGRRPKEKKAILDWARLEKEQLKFEEAVKVLKGTEIRREADRGKTGLLSWDYFNKDALLLLGDVYLDWAEEDPSKYAEARRNYAWLIERYGQTDLYMGRMLLYFIRTDNIAEVDALVERYVSGREESEKAKIPFEPRTLAELGGYLLDREKLADVRIILTSAALKDPALPEAHYHLARYFRRAGDRAEERKALDNALKTFALLPGLGAKRQAQYIDGLIWRARFRLEGGEWMAAEQDFGAAAAEYERGLELGRLKRGPRFAEAYAGLAEVAYWQRMDLPAALGLYERAAADGFDPPDARYKRAYILYRSGRTAESLVLFHRAGLEGEGSPYLDYAFGAALYARGDYFAAEGYFRRVVERMGDELRKLSLPQPQKSPSQGEIVELLMKAQNNLGAALYKVAGRVGDPKRRGAAMASFAESTRLFDSLTRDQETLSRTEAKNLGFLNMDFILHPQRGIDLAIYAEIEREMAFPRRR